MPAPEWNHSIIVENTRDTLVPQPDPRGVASTFGLVIRKQPLTTRVPELVVEVLSPSNTRFERGEKLGDYASIGVAEARTVEVLLLESGYLRRSQILAEGFLRPKLFPGVQVDVAQIWA